MEGLYSDNYYKILSSYSFEKSYDLDDLPHSLFTYCLINGLKGRADIVDTNTKIIDFSELGNYLSNEMLKLKSLSLGINQTAQVDIPNPNTQLISYMSSDLSEAKNMEDKILALNIDQVDINKLKYKNVDYNSNSLSGAERNDISIYELQQFYKAINKNDLIKSDSSAWIYFNKLKSLIKDTLVIAEVKNLMLGAFLNHVQGVVDDILLGFYLEKKVDNDEKILDDLISFTKSERFSDIKKELDCIYEIISNKKSKTYYSLKVKESVLDYYKEHHLFNNYKPYKENHWKLAVLKKLQFNLNLLLYKSDSALVYNAYGDLSEKTYDYNSAEEQYRASIDIEPSWIQPRVNLIKLLLKQEKKDEAINLLIETIQIELKNPYIHYAIGETYFGLKQYKTAEKYLKKALKLNQNTYDKLNNKILKYLGKTYIETNIMDKADSVYKKMYESLDYYLGYHYVSSNIIDELAKYCLIKDDTVDALRKFDLLYKFSEVDSLLTIAYVHQDKAHFSLMNNINYLQIKKFLDTSLCIYLLKNYKDNNKRLIRNSYAILGLSHLDANKKDKALAFFKKSIDLDSNFIFGLYNYGKVLMNLNKNNEAITYFDKVLKNDSTHLESVYFKGLCLYNLSNFTKALKHFDFIIANDSLDHSSWFWKGQALMNLKKYEEAIESYDRAISIDSNYIYAWNNRGYAKYLNKEYNEAIKDYKVVLKIASADAHLLWRISYAYKRLGMLDSMNYYFDKTYKTYNDRIANDSSDYGAINDLTELYLTNNKINDADRTLKVGLAGDPNYFQKSILYFHKYIIEELQGVDSRVSKAVFYETVKEEFVGGWNFHETNLWLDQNTKLSKKQKAEIRKMIELVENK